nr:retrovirus-related Pol polyprotein from transposon TNT 1-94 [Tanacetum cinerariifolium]
MSTQQDIYAPGSKSRPPMLNKENYVPWSSHLLRYAKSRPNGKLIHNSILNGPYVRKMIPEPGDANREITVTETFHLQTDNELSEKELKQIEVDDQAIQTIFSQMMKGYDIGIQEKKAKLFNEWERQMQMVGGNSGNQFRQYAGQNAGNPAGYNDVIGNQVIQNAVQNLRVQNVGNPNGLIGVQGNENQNQIGNEECDLMAAAADLNEIKEVNANCILMANLQQASTSSTQTDSAPVYDTNRSAKVHENCDDNEIFNMFTQEEQYTELLEPIPESHQVPQNDNDVISKDTSVEQGGEPVEQHPVSFEETRALYEPLYHNLKFEVEKVNSVNRKLKETNADLTTELARFKNQERYFEISQEKYDRLERCYQQSVYQEQSLSKKINALHLSTGKQIMTLNEQISELNKQLSKEKSTVFFLLEEKKKLKSDFKTCKDKLLDKQIQLEKKIKELNNIVLKTDEADTSLAKHKALELEIERLLKAVGSQDIISVKLENENVELEFQVLNYARENAHLKATYKNLFDSISTSRAQTQTIIASLQKELQSTKYKNSKLRTQLFKKVFDQKDNTQDSSVNTKFAKQPIMENLPNVGEIHALSKPVTSNSVSTPQESKGVNNDKVISPGMFRINPSKTSKEDKHVPNTVSASNRTKPITVSQPPVITKKDVNFDLNGLSSTGVDSTKTRRPQPRNNTKNDRVPSASKSSRSQNKEAEVKEHHRNLLLSKNNKHISSACNNIQIDSQDVISKVVCAMCTKCLIFVNHDKRLRNYVNGNNSRGKKQKAKVSFKENQIKYQPKVTKPKKAEHHKSLATPKTRKSRLLLRWSPTGKLFDKEGKIVDSKESKSFGDLLWGNILITRVYFVKGLGHNLFSVGQFCDSDLEVAFRRDACFVRNLEGVDLLKGDRSTNLYTINLNEMASTSPICLMARASSTKSWLRHQRFSHLNFDTINDLARNDLVAGLPKFKYHKEHLCPS